MYYLYLYRVYTLILANDTSSGFTALRAYALTRRRWLSALVFVLLCIQVVLNMVHHTLRSHRTSI